MSWARTAPSRGRSAELEDIARSEGHRRRGRHRLANPGQERDDVLRTTPRPPRPEGRHGIVGEGPDDRDLGQVLREREDCSVVLQQNEGPFRGAPRQPSMGLGQDVAHLALHVAPPVGVVEGAERFLDVEHPADRVVENLRRHSSRLHQSEQLLDERRCRYCPTLRKPPTAETVDPSSLAQSELLGMTVSLAGANSLGRVPWQRTPSF